MAEMLSYLGSRSSEYVWEEEREVQFADENFSREIMQLFSIGLVKLNIDGTIKNDSNGDAIPTYDNNDITEYARVWTGFRRQQQRANVEERGINVNSIDPMAIHIKWRDQFPKMGLENTYIGDGYPLCNDLPRDSFLKANAKFRLIGKSKISDLQVVDPNSVVSLDESSLLLQKLCDPYPSGTCSFPGVVYIEHNIRCTGVECTLKTPPRILKVRNNVHYEYIKPPCIHFPLAKNNLILVIDSDGKVAIERENSPLDSYHTLTYFRVEWRKGRYPHAQRNACGGGDCQIVGSFCRCQTTLQETRAFSEMPTRDEVLSELHIGAISPHMLSYASLEINSEFTVYSLMSDQLLGRNSAFKLKDDFGRQVLLKNMLSSIVILRWGESDPTQFRFRNAPSFYGDAPVVRDAQYETEAALDHYFYHDNTAPFISLRLIQRFGISNPSPRYIKTVSLAFRSGKYQALDSSFGTGNYGDLAATFAAILLDRESRNSVLEMDPSFGGIREPLLKIVSTLRSMDYNHTSRDFFSLHNLYSTVGQGPYDLPSVFSFFLPEYSPPGMIAQASLSAPEAMVLPNSIGFLNGMISLVKNG